MRAAYQTAHELGERLLGMAQSLHDPALLLEGRFGIGISLYYLGDFVASREQCTQGLRLYDPQQHRSRAAFLGRTPASRATRVKLWPCGCSAIQTKHCAGVVRH